MTESTVEKTKQFNIDLSDLIIAATSQDGGGFLQIDAYLDTVTGETVSVTDDARAYLDEDKIGDLDLADDEVFANYVQEQSIPNWLMETVQHAWRIEYQSVNRYLELPQKMSYEAYDEMRRFIDTVDDNRMAARLEKAIVGKGAFRRFKDALRNDEKVLQAWYDYQAEVEERWILDWLESEGIEVVSANEA